MYTSNPTPEWICAVRLDLEEWHTEYSELAAEPHFHHRLLKTANPHLEEVVHPCVARLLVDSKLEWAHPHLEAV